MTARFAGLAAPSRPRPSPLIPPAFDRADGFGPPPQSAVRPLALAEADLRLLNALAAHQIRYGKPAEALAMLQLTVRLAPGDAQSLRLLSEAFLATGDGETAHAAHLAYEAAAAHETATAGFQLRRARVMTALRRFGEAVEAFTQFVQLRRAGR